MIDFQLNPDTCELTCVVTEKKLDSVVAQQATELMRQRLDNVAATVSESDLRIIIDLKNVDYLSSLFLRLVGMTAKRVGSQNLSVINASRHIQDLFKTAGMEQVLGASANAEHEEENVPVFPPPAQFVGQANLGSLEEYRTLHRQSLEDPETFWRNAAQEHLVWDTPFEQVLKWENSHASWFEGGTLNACYNCLDKHLSTPVADKTAILWEAEPESADQQAEVRTLTYRQLHEQVCKFANVLKQNGITKGDRVILYIPMVPEAAVAMLACARLGALHSVVFAGFSPQAIAERVNDSSAKMIITCDGSYRRGKALPLKAKVDEALEVEDENGARLCRSVEKVITLKHTGITVSFNPEIDIWWHEAMAGAEPSCPAVPVASEDGLFILYTSGSTGKPKGVYHTTAGYLLGTKLSHHYVFDIKPDDVYWCTADVGWITGHSYIVYGPLANGCTVMMYEGAPNYPDPGRFWKIVEKHRVTVFYTAPTAIRSFMQWGDEWPEKYDLSSLRLLGSVGEPINPQAWLWYYEYIGKKRCPIVDTWWQTETGAIMIAPLPGAVPLKPGSATFPFFGVEVDLVDESGEPVGPGVNGHMIVRSRWPSMLRGLWQAEERYQNTYWQEFPGSYDTGDGARKDHDGYFWITGRIDDVINVSGHRIGTAEIESALISHPGVAEAAAVGRADDVKGAVIVVFVTLKDHVPYSPALTDELRSYVGKELGAVTKPEEVRFVEALPKTRSGKIMRRFLKQIAAGTEISGDITTLEDLNVLARICPDD